jgi:hypothetical protein
MNWTMPPRRRHRKERTSTNVEGRSRSRENMEELPVQSSRKMSSQPRPQQQKRGVMEALAHGFRSRVPVPPEKQAAEITYEGDPASQASEWAQSPYTSDGSPIHNTVTVSQPPASVNTQHGSTPYNASQNPRFNVDFNPSDMNGGQLYSHPPPMHMAPTNRDAELHHPKEGSDRQTAIPRVLLPQDAQTPYFGGTLLHDENVRSHFFQRS